MGRARLRGCDHPAEREAGQDHRHPGQRDAAVLPQGAGRQQVDIDPTVEPQLLEWEGLRGFQVFEVKGPTPRDWELLATGPPTRTTGRRDPGGQRRTGRAVYYGGDYLFVASAPDNTFTNQPYKTTLWTAGHIAYDVSDPAKPRSASSTWWVDGSRTGEEADSAYLAHNPRWNNKTPGSDPAWGCSCPARSSRAGSTAMRPRAAKGSSCWTSPTRRTCARSAGAAPVSVAGTEGDNVDTTQVEATGIRLRVGLSHEHRLLRAGQGHLPDRVSDPTQPRLTPDPSAPDAPAGAPFTDYAQRRGSFGPKRSGLLHQHGHTARRHHPVRVLCGRSADLRRARPEDPKVAPSSCPRWVSRSTTTWRHRSTASSWSGTATSSGCSPTTASMPSRRRSWARSSSA